MLQRWLQDTKHALRNVTPTLPHYKQSSASPCWAIMCCARVGAARGMQHVLQHTQRMA